jgi:homoserine kinase
MATWPAGPVTVQVPATSANLGPGFDSLGLALSLHNTVTALVRPGDTEIESFGLWPGGQQDLTEDNLILRAMRAGFAALGGTQPPGIAISCRNEVPQGFGLGSSAAAIVSGIVAARALAGPDGVAALPDADVLRLATEIEGHPDNVAACLSGGLTICWAGAAGVQVAVLTPLPALTPVLCIPVEPLPTEAARKVLPAQVPHADAAANSARAALLIAALTGQPELLLAGTEDFLHQQYRAAEMPATAELISRLRDAGIAAVVSGAGPAVLALTVAGQRPSAEDVVRIAGEPVAAWRVLPLRVDTDGARVLPG